MRSRSAACSRRQAKGCSVKRTNWMQTCSTSGGSWPWMPIMCGGTPKKRQISTALKSSDSSHCESRFERPSSWISMPSCRMGGLPAFSGPAWELLPARAEIADRVLRPLHALGPLDPEGRETAVAEEACPMGLLGDREAHREGRVLQDGNARDAVQGKAADVEDFRGGIDFLNARLGRVGVAERPVRKLINLHLVRIERTQAELQVGRGLDVAIEVAAEAEMGNAKLLEPDRRLPGVGRPKKDRPKIVLGVGTIVLLVILAGEPLEGFPGQGAEAFPQHPDAGIGRADLHAIVGLDDDARGTGGLSGLVPERVQRPGRCRGPRGGKQITEILGEGNHQSYLGSSSAASINMAATIASSPATMRPAGG